MGIPFTVEQFLEVFESYNKFVGLSLIGLYGAAIFALYLIATNRSQAIQWSFWLLTFLWFWMGIIYHWLFFSKINPMAYLFGSLFIIQGILFVFAIAGRWANGFIRVDFFSVSIAVLLCSYALMAYPVLSYFFGHHYPRGPVFGLPCPTTIYTFGILTMISGDKRKLITLFLIPIIWSVVGTFAAISMNVYEDYGLLLSGVLSLGNFLRSQNLRTIKLN